MADPVELQRTRTSDGAIVNWELDDTDPDLPVSGPSASDPVVEYGVRARLGDETDAAATTGDGTVIALLKALRAAAQASDTDLSTIITKLDNVGFASNARMKIWDGVDALEINADGSINISGGSFSLSGDTEDLDSGGDTDFHDIVGIGLPGAGGHVLGGTATDPIRTDPTGTTTQPVSGTVSVSNPTADPETGLAKDATLTNNTQIARVADSSGAQVAGAITAPGASDRGLVVRNIPSGTQTISGTVTANAGTNLNTSALLTDANHLTRTGALTETAPATDTASSGLNGRLQRIAQRLTSLIALLPTSLGQKTKAGSLAVTLASDENALAVTGPLTNAELTAVVPDEVGTWGYVAGTAATETLTGSKRVLQITAYTTSGDATLQINGGNTITIKENVGLDIAPRGNLTDPTLIFTGTSGYFVEYLT